ncbi:MAG: hypothetical protein WCO04_02105 [Pseudomonadota bacterium]
MKVIFHNGANKTGSTSIQIAFHKHLDLLADHNVFYPVFPGGVPSEHWQLRALEKDAIFPSFIRARMGNDTGPVLGAVVKEILSKTVDMARRSDGTILISTESHMNDQALLAIKGFFEAHVPNLTILVYIRPRAEFFVSGLQHNLRHDFTSRTNVTGDQHLVKLNTLDKVFGKDNVKVRIFDRRVLQNGDIVSDFRAWLERHINFELPEFRATLSVNQSISAASCAAVLRVKEMLSGDDAERRFLAISKLITRYDAKLGGAGMKLSSDMIQRLHTTNHVESWNQHVARTEHTHEEKATLFLVPQQGDLPAIEEADVRKWVHSFWDEGHVRSLIDLAARSETPPPQAVLDDLRQLISTV